MNDEPEKISDPNKITDGTQLDPQFAILVKQFANSASTGVTKITAGSGISVSPPAGTGNVTVTNSDKGSSVTDATLATSDITTNDVSTSKHGFAPKAPNDATKFLNGTGAYSTPASGGMTWKFGTSSRGTTAASGSQTIAHGLGKTPSYITISAGFVTASSNTFGNSYGSFDGTTQSVAWWVQEPGGGSQGASEAGLIIHLAGVSAGQNASVAFDATNITLTWSREAAGYTGGTLYFHWTVWG